MLYGARCMSSSPPNKGGIPQMEHTSISSHPQRFEVRGAIPPYQGVSNVYPHQIPGPATRGQRIALYRSHLLAVNHNHTAMFRYGRSGPTPPYPSRSRHFAFVRYDHGSVQEVRHD